jgi:hypothetical protein
MAILPIAAIGLVPLVNMLIEDMSYIMLAKEFDSDLESNMILLNNSAMRVSCWLETVGLLEADQVKIGLGNGHDSALDVAREKRDSHAEIIKTMETWVEKRA